MWLLCKLHNSDGGPPTQVTYLDSLIWVRVPWTPIGKALRAIFVKNKALSKAYMDLADTTGKLSFILLYICCTNLRRYGYG